MYVAIILLIAFGIWTGLGLIEILFMKKDEIMFNNGHCPECNSKIQCKGVDFGGGKHYCCPTCGYECWVTYSISEERTSK